MRAARLLLAAAAVAAVLWIAFVTAGPPLVSRWLTRASGLTVEVGRIGTLGSVADRVRVRTKPGVEPFLEAARVRVGGAVRAFLRGEHALARLDLVHPTLRLRRADDGRLLPAGSDAWPLPPGRVLTIAEARVVGGRVVVDGRRVSVPRLELASVTLKTAPGGRVVAQAGVGAAGGTGTVRAELGALGVALAVDARGVEARRLPPLRGGRVSGWVHYSWAAGGAHAATGAVRGRGIRVATPAGPARIGLARLDGVEADLRVSSVRVGRAAVSDARVAPPGLDVIRLRGVARDLALPGGSSPVLVAGRIGRAGRVRARGTIDPARGALDGRVKADGVALAGLVPPAGRLRVVGGTLGGTATVSGPPLTLRDARMLVEGFRAVVADDAGELPLLAWQRLEADAARVDLLPLRVRTRRVHVITPSLTVRRDTRGFLPVAVVEEIMALPAVRAALTVPAHAAEPPDEAEVTVTIDDGTIALEDQAVQTPVAVSLRGATGAFRQQPGPPRTAELALDAEVDGGGAIGLEASVGGPAVTLSTEISNLPLAAVAGYLEPATGYLARGGTADVNAAARLSGATLDATMQVALVDPALERTAGADVLAEATGLAEPAALALMRDEDGRITLVLPYAGDARGLAPALPDLLRAAVADAIARPLLDGDAPRPVVSIDFPPGVAVPGSAGDEIADRLAVLMRRRASLTATVRGRSGPADAHELPHGADLTRLAGTRVEWLVARLCGARDVATTRVRTEAPLDGDPGVVVELGP